MPSRACGNRIAGGVYLEVPLSPVGMPLEAFLVDPPIKIDPLVYGVSPVGVTLVEVKGVTHVFDWVGSTYYPHASDFIEEVRHLGLSRRIARSADFSRLTSESTIILFHEQAHLDNWDQACLQLPDLEPWKCVALPPKHGPVELTSMCASLHWYHELESEESSRLVQVQNTDIVYPVQALPVKPQYSPAIFLRLPIRQIAVVNDPDNPAHRDTVEKVKRTQLPVLEVDE